MNSAPTAIDVGPKLASPFLDLLPITGLAICVIDRAERAVVIHASDDTAALLEETHFNLGEGPLFDCFATAHPILIPDVVEVDRWPLFLSAAQTLKVAAVFAFPLMLGAACVGAALCYRNTRGQLDSETLGVGRALGRAVAGQALRRAIVLAEGHEPERGCTDRTAP